MKNIANTVIFALLIGLSYSVVDNYKLLGEISSIYNYMEFSADQLKEINDETEKYYWHKSKLFEKTIFSYETNAELFTVDGKLVDDFFKSIDDNIGGTQRFFLEQQRRSKLSELIPVAKMYFFKQEFVHPRVDISDRLHIGFRETILDECIYEVYINGKKKEAFGDGNYKCAKAPKLLIEVNKISINKNKLDTICVSKLISRA